MKSTDLIPAAATLAILSGVFASAATGNPGLIDQRFGVDPAMQMAMHDDDMDMGGSGMMGGGMKGPGMKGPGTQDPPHAPRKSGPTTHGPGMQGPAPDPTAQGQAVTDGMIDLPWKRVEGRIAFLHAELQITEAQMPVWNEFTQVLRSNAKRMADAQKSATQRPTNPALARLDDQERWLAARLESVRALKVSYGKLYAALDDNQRKTADQLVTHQMGLR